MAVQYVDVSEKLPKELFEVVDAVSGLVEELAKGTNIFGAVISKLESLNKAVENAKQIGPDFSEDPGASVLCGGVLAKRIVSALVKKA